MKYSLLFGALSIMLLYYALKLGGFYYILIWGAVSFGVVSLAYLHLGPGVYGKGPDGVMQPVNIMILLPYLIFLWGVWHLLRLIKKEPPYSRLSEDLYIGRRLLPGELPDEIEVVVDLTCEFCEPKSIRSKNYFSFQILDGFAPKIEQINEWIHQIKDIDGKIYIHCAEGHGRTGLFTALYLMRKENKTVDEVIEFIQSKRPLVRLSSKQRELLKNYYL